jgi:hypothetical protein
VPVKAGAQVILKPARAITKTVVSSPAIRPVINFAKTKALQLRLGTQYYSYQAGLQLRRPLQPL